MLGEDDDRGGFSPFLWYKLGQSSAEASQLMDQTADLVRRGFRPPQVVIDRDNAVAEAWRLYEELNKANQYIRSWMRCSDELATTVAARDTEIVQLKAQITAVQERLDLAMKCYGSVSADSTDYLAKIQALEELVEKLRKGET